MRVKLLIAMLAMEFCFAGSAAPNLLSETGLYSDISTHTLSTQSLLFSPQYPLWSDGSMKKRWIALPSGTKVDNSNPDKWIFPVGTKLWKEFSYPAPNGGLRRVETRLLEKTSPTKWEFAAYQWNESETDATLVGVSGVQNVYPTAFGPSHDIPSRSACIKCHTNQIDPVLGFSAIQLSDDREPSSEPSATLTTFKALGWFTDQNLNLTPRIASVNEVERKALGYLHANCGSCHQTGGSAAFSQVIFRHDSTLTQPQASAAFTSTVDQLTTNYLIPEQTETYRIKRGEPEKSAVWYRMNLTTPERMPAVGTKTIDAAGLELIAEWIRGL